MRIGVLLLPTDRWPETVARVTRLEALGFDHLWTYDHLSWRRYRDRAWHAAIPWLTAVAGVTTRIRLGTMVASPTFRHPFLLAKEAITLDHVSNGRLTLGVGSGGTGFDATALGTDVLSTAARTARFEEFVAVLDAALLEPVVDHHGAFYTVDDARTYPGCVQRPRLPLAVAAGGTRTLALTARFADAWITYGDTAGGDRSAEHTELAVRRQFDALRAACEAAERNFDALDRIYLVGNTDERPLRSIDAFGEFVARYGDLGFTDIVFHHPRPDDPVWNEPESIVDEIAATFLSPP